MVAREKFNLGNGFVLELFEEGFVLWDKNKESWVIDGSLVAENSRFRVRKGLKRLAPNSFYHQEFLARDLRDLPLDKSV